MAPHVNSALIFRLINLWSLIRCCSLNKPYTEGWSQSPVIYRQHAKQLDQTEHSITTDHEWMHWSIIDRLVSYEAHWPYHRQSLLVGKTQLGRPSRPSDEGMLAPRLRGYFHNRRETISNIVFWCIICGVMWLGINRHLRLIRVFWSFTNEMWELK